MLCRELLRFLRSIDDTGAALKAALLRAKIVDIPDLADVVATKETLDP
jgi:hypothetical protein